jgi:hypothetical protein
VLMSTSTDMTVAPKRSILNSPCGFHCSSDVYQERRGHTRGAKRHERRSLHRGALRWFTAAVYVSSLLRTAGRLPPELWNFLKSDAHHTSGAIWVSTSRLAASMMGVAGSGPIRPPGVGNLARMRARGRIDRHFFGATAVDARQTVQIPRCGLRWTCGQAGPAGSVDSVAGSLLFAMNCSDLFTPPRRRTRGNAAGGV